MQDGRAFFFDPYHVWLGIPPEEQPPNHYRLLGLRALESDPEVISNALDQRLAFLRTFQGGKRSGLSQKLLNEVSAAGVVLLNPQKKERYDCTLRGPVEAPPVLGDAAAPLAQPAAGRTVAVAASPSGPRTGAKLPAAAVPATAVPAAALPVAQPVAPRIAPSEPASTFAVVLPEIATKLDMAPVIVAAPARATASVAAKPAEAAASSHLVPLLAAAVGLAGLAALAVGGWWLMREPAGPASEGLPSSSPKAMALAS